MADEELTVRPEIERIRALLRRMGLDESDPEAAEAGARELERLVAALVQLVRLEHDLHPADEAAAARALDALLERAGREVGSRQ